MAIGYQIHPPTYHLIASTDTWILQEFITHLKPVHDGKQNILGAGIIIDIQHKCDYNWKQRKTQKDRT